jgi:hypothetical protein
VAYRRPGLAGFVFDVLATNVTHPVPAFCTTFFVSITGFAAVGFVSTLAAMLLSSKPMSMPATPTLLPRLDAALVPTRTPASNRDVDPDAAINVFLALDPTLPSSMVPGLTLIFFFILLLSST